MAILLGVCHNVFLGGFLNETNILSINLAFQDIKSNLWQISFNDISFKSLDENLNVLCGVSCNFVTDLSYNNQKQVVKSQPILLQILLKGQKNDKSVIRCEKTWFYATDAQDTLEVKFNVIDNGTVVPFSSINCEIYATILLQRVK